MKARRGLDAIDKLPLLRAYDPVSRFLGFRVGDIIEVERHDAQLGRSLVHRRVVGDALAAAAADSALATAAAEDEGDT